MRHIKSRFLLFVVGALASAFTATAFAHDAKLIKLTGSVEVQLPGQAAQPGVVGMTIPQGAVVKTGNGSEAYIEAFNGAVATVTANSEVGLEKLNIETQDGKIVTQEAQIDLRRGNVVSTLDPSKKAINKYSVKTPKGVAAARGTVFGVSLDNVGGGSVQALTGTVTFTSSLGTFTLPVGGGEPLFLPFGAAEGSQPVPLSQAIAADPSGAIAAEVVAAVQVVAANVAASSSATGGTGEGAGATATAILAAVVKAAAQAVPNQVEAIAKVAISAVTSSGSQTSGNATAAAAITEALVTAAPTQAANITRAASAAVVETKVAEAVAAAKLSGVTDPAALAVLAQNATNEAQATVQVVAQTAVNTAVSVTVATSGGTDADKAAAAAAIAAQVSSAATTGSQQGANAATSDAGVTTTTTTTVVVTTPPATTQAPSTVVAPVEPPPVITPVDPTTISNGAGNGG